MSKFDFSAFMSFCNANAIDADDVKSRKVYTDSLAGKAPSGRDYNARSYTLLARGEDSEGATLLRTATNVASRSREHVAARLRWEMETNDGCTAVIVGTFEEILPE